MRPVASVGGVWPAFSRLLFSLPAFHHLVTMLPVILLPVILLLVILLLAEISPPRPRRYVV